MSVNSFDILDLENLLGELVDDGEYLYFVHGTDVADEHYGNYSDDFDKESEEYKGIIKEKLKSIFKEGLYARDSKIDITAIELAKKQDNSKKIEQLKEYIQKGYEYNKNTLILLEIPKKCFSDKIEDILPLFEYDKEGKGVRGITGDGLIEHYRIPKEYIKCAIFKNGKEDRYICKNECYDKSKIVEEGIVDKSRKIEVDRNSSAAEIKSCIKLCERAFDATNEYQTLRTEIISIRDILFDKMGEIEYKEYEEIYSSLEQLYQKSKDPIELQKDKIQQTDFAKLTDLEVRELLEEFYNISEIELQRNDSQPLWDKDSYKTYKECLALLKGKGISNQEDQILLNIKISNTKKYDEILQVTEDINFKQQQNEELTESEKKSLDLLYKLLDSIGKEDKDSVDNKKISDTRKQMEWFHKNQTMLTIQDINEQCDECGLDFNYEMEQARKRVELRTELDQTDLTTSEKNSSSIIELSDRANKLGLDIETEIDHSNQRKLLRKEMRDFFVGKAERTIGEINNRCNKLGLNFNYEMENAKILPIGTDVKNSAKNIAAGTLERDLREVSLEMENAYNELANPIKATEDKSIDE